MVEQKRKSRMLYNISGLNNVACLLTRTIHSIFASQSEAKRGENENVILRYFNINIRLVNKSNRVDRMLKLSSFRIF